MPLPTRITLPPSVRSPGGLLDAAKPTGVAEWWRGVVFSSGQCLAPMNLGPCSGDDEQVKGTQDLSDASEFQSFAVIQGVQCSTMGRTAVDQFAGLSLDVTREFGVALEFLGGAATGNPSLADAATPFAAAADPVAALGCLDAHASHNLSGRLAYIHVPVQVGTVLLSESAIWRDGRLWRTASGNIVVISPAYDGREPGAGAPGAGDPLYMYATGEVYAEVGQRGDILQSVERGQNTAQAWAEDAALVIFDPCYVVAINSGATACSTGS